GNWLDPVREQLVDEPVVEVEGRLVHGAAALRDDARPEDGEAERVETELAHERDVVGIAMVDIARHLAVVTVSALARRRREAVPDALAAPVLGRSAFDLVRRGRSTPEKAERKCARRLIAHLMPLVQVFAGTKVERAGS